MVTCNIGTAVNVTALGQKLQTLQGAASVVSRSIITTNKAFYEHLAELYVWWRDAEKVPGYLDAEYAKNGKKYKKNVQHGINFAPLFWLTWGYNNGLNDDKAGRWSRVLNQLHAKYQSEQQYHTDSVPKLGTYIEQNGGVEGLTGYGNKAQAATGVDDETDEDDDDGAGNTDESTEPGDANANPEMPPNRPRPSNEPTILVPEILEQLYVSARDHYEAMSAPPTITLNTTIPVADDGMALVLVRKVGNVYQLVGASSDETMIKPVAMQTYLQDFAALPKSIRALIETVSTQCLPKRIQNFYGNLADDAAKALAPSGKKSLRRLMYLHTSGEFLLSPIRAESGVVTYAKPFTPVLDQVATDVFLPNRNRKLLEKKLIASHDFNLFAPSNANTIPKFTAAAHLASHAIRLQHRFEPTNYLHLDFWPFYSDMPAPRGQLVAPGLQTGNGSWRAKLDLSWYRKFSLEFMSKWLSTHASHIKRDHQKVFKLELTKYALMVHFVHRNGDFESSLSVDFDATPTSENAACVHVLTKDFAVVMQAIADLGVTSEIDIDVDADGIAMKLATSAAQYRIVIPTCSVDGVRSTKHFDQFEPDVFVVDAFEDYNDQAEGDFDAE
jgi:hypothetical protein